jgi:hypothetical protein
MTYSFDIVDCLIGVKAKENDSSVESSDGERNLDIECVLIGEVLKPVINDSVVRLNRTLHFVFDMDLRIFLSPWLLSLALRSSLEPIVGGQYQASNTPKRMTAEAQLPFQFPLHPGVQYLS